MPDCFALRPSPGTGTLIIRPLQGRTALMLAGEADITTRDALRAALAALPADGAGDIHLDLTGLRFIDLCCTRELIAFTARHPAVRLIAHDPPACLRRITALLYPQASITFIAGSRPDTGTAGRPGPDADPARDGGGSGPGGSPGTGRGAFARHHEEMPAGPPPGRAVPRPERWRSRGGIAGIARRWHLAGTSPRVRTRLPHGS